jgi:hypothetical protein
LQVQNQQAANVMPQAISLALEAAKDAGKAAFFVFFTNSLGS